MAGPGQKQDAPQSTVLQKLTGKSFEPPRVEAASLKRDAFKAAPDLEQAKGQCAGLKQETLGIKAACEKEIKGAMGEAVKAVTEIAQEQKIAIGPALATCFPNAGHAELTIICNVLSDMAFKGAGSFISAVQKGATSISEIVGDVSRLDADKAESLIADAHARLTGQTSAPQEMALSAGSNPAPATQSKYDWSAITPEELGEFMANPKDQPEMRQIEAVEAALDDVEKNHIGVEEHQEKGLHEDAVAAESLTTAECLLHSSALKDISGVACQPEDIAGLDSDAREALLKTLTQEPDPHQLLAAQQRQAFNVSAAV